MPYQYDDEAVEDSGQALWGGPLFKTLGRPIPLGLAYIFGVMYYRARHTAVRQSAKLVKGTASAALQHALTPSKPINPR